MRSLIRRTLIGVDGPQEATVAAVNRRGRGLDVRVMGSALRGESDEATGVILTMEGVNNHGTEQPVG